MNHVAAFIPTRDGAPNFHVARLLSEACRRVGATWGHTVCPHSVDVARNQAVALAYGQHASHLFFVDNDTHIEVDALEKLLSLEAAVATGCTPTTSRFCGEHESEPFINIAMATTPDGRPIFLKHWFNGPREALYCGASCLLVRMDVFAHVGFPWFAMRHEWDGRHYRNVSEDLDFCERVRRAGLQIMAHGDVRCDHDRGGRLKHRVIDEAQSYGSHQPVLRALAALRPKTVLEYGCGEHSTRLFLDRGCFPDVESIEVRETDAEWASRFCDERVRLHVCLLPDIAASRGADVVMIDCAAEWNATGYAYKTRSDLFRLHAADRIAQAVVLHDVEHPELAKAFHESAYTSKRIYAPPDGPHTGIASNTFNVNQLAI